MEDSTGADDLPGPAPLTLSDLTDREVIYVNGEPVKVADYIRENTVNPDAASSGVRGRAGRIASMERSQQDLLEHLNKGYQSGAVRLTAPSANAGQAPLTAADLPSTITLDNVQVDTQSWLSDARKVTNQRLGPAATAEEQDRREAAALADLNKLHQAGRVSLAGGATPYLGEYSRGSSFSPLQLLPVVGAIRAGEESQQFQSVGGGIVLPSEQRRVQTEAALTALDLLPLPAGAALRGAGAVVRNTGRAVLPPTQRVPGTDQVVAGFGGFVGGATPDIPVPRLVLSRDDPAAEAISGEVFERIRRGEPVHQVYGTTEISYRPTRFSEAMQAANPDQGLIMSATPRSDLVAPGPIAMDKPGLGAAEQYFFASQGDVTSRLMKRSAFRRAGEGSPGIHVYSDNPAFTRIVEADGTVKQFPRRGTFENELGIPSGQPIPPTHRTSAVGIPGGQLYVTEDVALPSAGQRLRANVQALTDVGPARGHFQYRQGRITESGDIEGLSREGQRQVQERLDAAQTLANRQFDADVAAGRVDESERSGYLERSRSRTVRQIGEEQRAFDEAAPLRGEADAAGRRETRGPEVEDRRVYGSARAAQHADEAAQAQREADERQRDSETPVDRPPPVRPIGGGDDPVRPIGGGDDPVRPIGGGDDPVRPIGGGDDPVRPIGGGDDPVRPIGGGDDPVRPIGGGDDPVRPIGGGDDPVRPIGGGDDPVRPIGGGDDPVRPIGGGDDPVRPIGGGDDPVRPIGGGDEDPSRIPPGGGGEDPSRIPPGGGGEDPSRIPPGGDDEDPSRIPPGGDDEDPTRIPPRPPVRRDDDDSQEREVGEAVPGLHPTEITVEEIRSVDPATGQVIDRPVLGTAQVTRRAAESTDGAEIDAGSVVVSSRDGQAVVEPDLEPSAENYAGDPDEGTRILNRVDLRTGQVREVALEEGPETEQYRAGDAPVAPATGDAPDPFGAPTPGETQPPPAPYFTGRDVLESAAELAADGVESSDPGYKQELERRASQKAQDRQDQGDEFGVVPDSQLPDPQPWDAPSPAESAPEGSQEASSEARPLTTRERLLQIAAEATERAGGSAPAEQPVQQSTGGPSALQILADRFHGRNSGQGGDATGPELPRAAAPARAGAAVAPGVNKDLMDTFKQAMSGFQPPKKGGSKPMPRSSNRRKTGPDAKQEGRQVTMRVYVDYSKLQEKQKPTEKRPRHQSHIDIWGW